VIYNIYNILTHAHTEKKRAAVTSLGHRRQCWQVGTPLSLCNKDLSLSTYYKAVREGGGGESHSREFPKVHFWPSPGTAEIAVSFNDSVSVGAGVEMSSPELRQASGGLARFESIVLHACNMRA
jgi:hypothetical protein